MESGRKSIDKIRQSLLNSEKKLFKKKKELNLFKPNTNKVLDISVCKTEKRYGRSGISTCSNSNKWFLMPKGKAIFKNQEHSLGNIQALNEIICSKLCKQIEIPCAEYEFAKLKNYFGTVSYNFLKEDEWLLEGSYLLSHLPFQAQHSFTEYKSILEYDKEITHRFDYDSEEILFGLYKILLFDFLTSQTDRHDQNIAFVCSKDENEKIKLTLAPLFDNELSFGDMSVLSFKDYDYNIYDYKTYPGFHIFSSKYGDESPYEKIALDIISLTNFKEEYKNYYNFVMNNLSITKCFNELEKEGHKLSLGTKYWYLNSVNHKKEILRDAEKKYSQNKQQTPQSNDPQMQQQ